MHKAVFLDRDGTLIRDNPYNADPSKIEILPTVIDSLKRLQAAGYKLIIITNQSGIGRGLITYVEYVTFQAEMLRQFAAHGISFLESYFCPHHPEAALGDLKRDCTCRKPGPGLLLAAIKKYDIDPTQSFMIGDKLSDVQAGEAVGATGLLIDPPNGPIKPLIDTHILCES